MMHIALLGAGRVGLVSAVCYVELGHVVSLVDIDENKVHQIRAAKAPFLEKGLDEMLARGISSGRLHVMSQLNPSLELDAFLICLPTEPLSSGEADLSSIKEAFVSIRAFMRARQHFPPIIVRSTVSPKAIRLLFQEYFLLEGIQTHLVLNPEFLREGSAIDDFLNPSFCIAGGDNPDAIDCALNLYASIDCQKYKVSLESAGLLKHACNAFHALKISFANEIGRLAGQIGADGEEVMRILGSDTKLNASSAYLRPGFAFGGPCLGKDLNSLLHMAQQHGLSLPLLENISQSNEMHLKSCVDAIVGRGVSRIGLIGVSFKRGTGDLRYSPYIELAKRLEERSISVMVYDEEIAEFSGSNNLQNILNSSDLIAMTNGSLTTVEQQLIIASKLPIFHLEKTGICGH